MSEHTQRDIVLFDFTSKDVKELSRLSREYYSELSACDDTLLFAEGWEKRYLNLMNLGIDSVRFHIRGARIDDEIAGFIMFGHRIEPMWQVSNRGYISNIYVVPSHRRKGVGRMMVLDAIEKMLADGSQIIDMEVYTKNEPARAFWEHFGFRAFKHRLRLPLHRQK